MSTNHSSDWRHFIGFVVGGTLAAAATGLLFVAFFPLPKDYDPRNHTGEVFVMTTLVMLVCGGFIGRRGFTAEAWSDFIPSVIGTYAVVLLLPLFAGLSFGEVLPLVGLASAGVVTSVAGSLLLLRFFPLRSPDEHP